ncbi:MAG: hypothetical protein EBY28_23590 [Betaproteobacteria bacterium]|nr:hypothetical protein [Betaproteobacteria bacterium]
MTQLFTRAGTARTANCTGGYSYTSKCTRCGGAGGRPEWNHSGYVCFLCGGSGVGKVKVDKLYTAEQNAKLDATAAKRAEASTAKTNAINAEFVAKLQGLDGDFWVGFRESFLARAKAPTERQIALVDAEVAKRAKAPSQHFGYIGDKVTLTLTCERELRLESQFGTSWMSICRDAAGNVVIYKGNADFLRQGDTGEVKATIKEHAVYNGVAQTMIMRPKVTQAA